MGISNLLKLHAPLLFLILDAASTSTGSENEKEPQGKVKIKGDFASDYMGRARAEFAAQSPESFLSSEPKENFKSRYADPNHPASSGNPWSLITAGEFNPPMGKDLVAARIDGGRGGGLGGLGGLLGAGRTDSSRRQRLIGGRMDRQQQVNNPGGMNGLGELGNFVDLNMLDKGVKKILDYVSADCFEEF